MNKIILFLLLLAATMADAAAQGFDTRFFNNQFLAAGAGTAMYDHDAGTSKGRGFEAAIGNWILKDMALRIDFGFVEAGNALGCTSRFVNGHCDFLWDVEGAVTGVYNPRRAFSFYPEAGFGFLSRLAVVTADGQPLRYDADFLALAGAMIQLRLPGMQQWPLFVDARVFLLPQNYDSNREASALYSLTFGVMRDINYDPVHKRLPGESRDWTCDWFVGMGAGADFSVMPFAGEDVTSGSRTGWNADLTLGRNLSSLWTVRLGLGAVSGTSERERAEGFGPEAYRYSFFDARADLMFNVSNIFGFRHGSRFNALPYAGCGLVSRFDSPSLVMGADAGFEARLFLSRNVDLYADARYLMVPPRFTGGRHSFDNGFAFFNIGFIYNFAASCRYVSQTFSLKP